MNADNRYRRSIRLPGYDYTRAGAYFITICTQDRTCLFGDVADGRMVLNDVGRMAEKCWTDIPDHFPYVELDFVYCDGQSCPWDFGNRRFRRGEKSFAPTNGEIDEKN